MQSKNIFLQAESTVNALPPGPLPYLHMLGPAGSTSRWLNRRGSFGRAAAGRSYIRNWHCLGKSGLLFGRVRAALRGEAHRIVLRRQQTSVHALNVRWDGFLCVSVYRSSLTGCTIFN